jgi:hypothetical protein
LELKEGLMESDLRKWHHLAFVLAAASPAVPAGELDDALTAAMGGTVYTSPTQTELGAAEALFGQVLGDRSAQTEPGLSLHAVFCVARAPLGYGACRSRAAPGPAAASTHFPDRALGPGCCKRLTVHQDHRKAVGRRDAGRGGRVEHRAPRYPRDRREHRCGLVPPRGLILPTPD